jgi:transposase InsO family protein
MEVLIEDLTAQQREWLACRVAHLLEVETGFRGGGVLLAVPGEPRAAYDPAATTLEARRRAKVQELSALGDQARLLGFAQVSVRTLRRMAAAYAREGVVGLVDGRWVRRGGGRPSVSPQVLEALEAVRAETLHRSRVSMRTRDRMVRQFIAEVHGSGVSVPGYDTLRAVWKERYGTGGRQRYVRSAASAAEVATGVHVVVHRPGQVIALDTTPLPVKLREQVFGEPVSAVLLIALDVYTHTLAGFRLALVAESSVDVAMLLRDVATPTRMRSGWGPGMAWRYPGIAAEHVEAMAGYPVAAVPFFLPETVTTDHGSPYKSHALVAAQRALGVNILPSRVLRPTDKAACERAFSTLCALLFEHLLGYQGRDVADRGADVEGDAVLSLEQMEDLVAEWRVRVWQNRLLREAAPSWDVGGRHSPNTLFSACTAQGGFAPRILAPGEYYRMLPAHHVKIHARRGVRIGGLWYDGPGLDPYRGQVSQRGGAHKGEWVVRRDPRDRRFVFFADPGSGQFHTLRWNGLGPDDGDVPAFSDARVHEVLAQARAAGLGPRTDAELLPVLLELLAKAGQQASAWPTRPRGARRSARAAEARERAAARAAAGDRAGAAPIPVPEEPAAPDLAAVIDAERRRRREAAVGRRPRPAPPLGEASSNRSLLKLPDGTDGGRR